jgi:hypothetical protein
MNRVYFHVPYIKALETESGWNSDPDIENMYSVIRCHYLLNGPNQLSDPEKMGEVVDVLKNLKGLTQKKGHATEYEVTTMQVEEAVKESVREEESVQEFVSSLSASLGSEKVGKISSEIKDSLKTRLQETFKSSFKVQVSETFREKRTVTWEGIIDPEKLDEGETVNLVKAYKRYSFDLYLLFIDYLFVEYKSSTLGVILKRSKLPPVVGNNHRNIIRFDSPLVSLRFWGQLPDTLLPIDQSKYTLEVDDPLDITTENLKKYKSFPVKLPPKPTLYDLSEKAFPRKKKWGLW